MSSAFVLSRYLVLLTILVLLIGCGGGNGSSHSDGNTNGSTDGGSTDGGSTGESAGGFSTTITSHLSYVTGFPAQAYAASTAPQTVRLIVGLDTITLDNAMVTTDLRTDRSYAFLNVGSKPVNGTRGSNSMSVYLDNFVYNVPLDAEGATTRPVLAFFGQTVYPTIQVGKMRFPNGIRVLLVTLGTVGQHTADLSGTCVVDEAGGVSGTATLTFPGGYLGGPSSNFIGSGGTIGYYTGSSGFKPSPVTAAFGGQVNLSSDLSFSDAEMQFGAP